MARLGMDYGTTNTVVVSSDRGHYPVVPHVTETAIGPVTRDVFPSLVVYDRRADCYFFGTDAERCLVRPGAEDRCAVIRSLKRGIRDYAEGKRVSPDQVPGGYDPADVLRQSLAAVQASIRRSGLIPEPEPLEAVITWPAHANGAQRHVLRRSYREAGFEVIGTLSEPAAAAIEFADRLARGHRQRARQLSMTLAVFDLGGGTFDASLVRIDGTEFTVLATAGIERLGGDDFDEVLARLFAGRLGMDLGSLAPFRRGLLLAHARHQKESISSGSARSLTLSPEDIGLSGRTVSVPVEEYLEALEPLIEPAVEKLAGLAGASSSGAASAAPESRLDGIYLVGGSSKLPLVPVLLERRFPGVRQVLSDKPFTAVAMGAAIHSADEIQIHDILSRTFGVIRLSERGTREVFAPVFPGGMRLPARGSPHVQICIEYAPQHSIGHLRYLECTAVDEQGQPSEGVRRWSDVLFPYDPQIPVGIPLSPSQIVERPDLATHWIRETYACDPDGVISVRILRGCDGQSCSFEIFQD